MIVALPNNSRLLPKSDSTAPPMVRIIMIPAIPREIPIKTLLYLLLFRYICLKAIVAKSAVCILSKPNENESVASVTRINRLFRAWLQGLRQQVAALADLWNGNKASLPHHAALNETTTAPISCSPRSNIFSSKN